MKLSPVDRQNPLWHTLKRHFEEELAKARSQNDSVGLNAEQTAYIRGDIARLKKILEMDRDLPVVE